MPQRTQLFCANAQKRATLERSLLDMQIYGETVLRKGNYDVIFLAGERGEINLKPAFHYRE